MVTTEFLGRLGNSMFQIAAAIGYAKKYGYKWGVPSNQRESSILTHFPNLPRCDDRPKRYREDQDQWHDTYFNYREIPDVGPDVTLFGFWQSWKYFAHCEDAVKKVFKLDFIPGYEDCVSIHVRRGDYVKYAGSFPPVTPEYILKAMQFFLDKNPLQRFIVFSDDIKWCTDNIKLHTYLSGNESDEEIKTIQKLMDAMVEFSEGRNEFQDLSLMASCGHHIIANSSFSWWGAYIGHNPNKIVVSPSCERGNWFGMEAGVKHDVVDLLPPDWIQIKFR